MAFIRSSAAATVRTRTGTPTPTGVPVVVAHRGHSTAAPENTLPAFAAAAAAGAGMIETDVRLTSDGTAVLLHDATLGRTTNLRGRVDRTPADKLAGADAGSWFSCRYRSVPPPTVGDLTAFLGEYPTLGLLLEFKGEWAPRQVEPVADALWAGGLSGRTLVQAFSRRTLAALALAAPDFPRGLLVSRIRPGRGGEGALLRFLSRVEAAACNPGGELLRRAPALPGRLRAEGMRLYPWTLDRPAQWRDALAAGADGIITNRPGELAAWRNARAENWTAGPI